MSWDTLVARAGYIIAYVAGDTVKSALDDYEPRPIEPHIFAKTYKPWDDARWKPSNIERHLLALGCKPFYKVAGVSQAEARHLRAEYREFEAGHRSGRVMAVRGHRGRALECG